MKRIIALLLLTLVFGAGCHGSKPGGLGGSGLTTTIVPSRVMPGPPPVAGPITVTSSRQPANQILVTALFSGPSTLQAVAVTSSAGGAPLASFSNTTGGNTNPMILAGPGTGVTYTVTSTIGGQPYATVTDVPNVANEPDIAGVFSDAAGDTVTVFVMDLGTP